MQQKITPRGILYFAAGGLILTCVFAILLYPRLAADDAAPPLVRTAERLFDADAQVAAFFELPEASAADITADTVETIDEAAAAYIEKYNAAYARD